jgi:hypothetical protein
MKTSNIVLLGLIGAALYYFYKQKQKANKTDYPTAPNPERHASGNPPLPLGIVPINETGVPAVINKDTGAAIVQTLDAAGKPVEIKYQVRYAIKGIPNII